MRRTTLHRTTVTSVAAVTLLLVGCGSQNGGTGADSGAGSPSRSASASASASASTAPATSSSPAPTEAECTHNAELTTADDGRTICLTTGGQVRLTLDGTKERPWKPVVVTGDVLKAANPGIVILPGDAVAAYDAVATGTAKLTSSRPLCARSSSPGQVSCQGIERWTVTVRVR
ncbi:hypothetical protein [Streptomyces sp. NPDC058964]|uniref:hypothetical protein n=1 Tax=Streptomyces sp. NPDC058964 TaxID=3346681 RepID=UPI0036AF569F